jgi:cytoskeletal protein RodZ
MTPSSDDRTGPTVGQRLSSDCVARGVTLEELSQATQLRASALDAMEHDDFSVCGGAAYARGQLRCLAPLLGLDPEELVEAYYEDHRSGTAA